MINNRHSPIDLRDGLERDELDTYQPPRSFVRQSKIDTGGTGSSAAQQRTSSQHQDEMGPLFHNRKPMSSKKQSGFKQRLSRGIARLSSLDSTRSSSSMEMDSNEQGRMPMPMISITTNDNPSLQATGLGEVPTISENQRQQNVYRDYYGRPRIGAGIEEYEDDDEDSFVDSPLPIPYSSSAMSRSTIVRQQTNNGVSYPTTRKQYEELLDDRQGMNDSEQQFTKAEKANRPSIDSSIISELRLDGKKASGDKGSGSSKKDKQRRSKSPSSSSLTKRNRQSRRGFLGLASRLKLTKKHESIAKLQLSILNSGFASLKTLDKDLQSFLPKERLTVKQFEERVKLMRKYEILSTIEYRFASKYETYVCKHAQQETNAMKNNYKKCIPYDYNRVVLKTLPNVADSDYINASHVDSCLKPNAYIAAQGPNEFTIDEFWRMVWEQKTFVIVMLTKVFDFIRVMCNQYWPVEVNKPERYGNLEVTLLYEEPLADFVIRTIKLTKLKGNQTAQPGENSNKETNTATTGDQGTSSMMDKVGDATEGDSDDYEYSDETSGSEDLIITEGEKIIGGGESAKGLRQSLTVRAPKFVRTKSMRRERSASPQRNPGSSRERAVSPALSEGRRPSSSSRYERRTKDDHDEQQVNKTDTSTTLRRPQPPNEFLHPLFNSSRLGASSTSLTSEPMTPATPRTPSSAGLDRSSATRKAVKKKRRARVQNQRPKRTQFMVPTESQLIDDDDEDDFLPTGTATDDNEPDTGKTSKHNERIIYQFHYHSWASHTCPFISSLLHFRRRVRICMDEMAKSGKTGPTVVHCNDGCGRTGTYLCIDANLELAEEDNVFDVFNYTKKMRQSRKFLIENLEQYKFVYDTIEEAMFCGKTWFPLSELHKRLKHKSQRNPITKKNEYLREYEKICRMTSKFSIGDCAGGHRVENREKNRDVSTVPPDNFRPYLTSFQTNDSTDYINAVFVDGYTRSKEYIVTEWPLHKTISDFWSLVYDHDCNSVILLANPGESSTYPSFLPSEKELRRKFGPVFSAEMVSYTHYQNIKSWIYTINKKIVSLTEVIAGVKSEAKTTQVFQITCWPQGHRVPTSTNALVELMNMVERWRQRTTYGPVCVVSLNGKSRAGVYCAANVAIEQVVQHSEVDVFQAVKTVRRHRPHLIENMTEYKYCYDLILHYVLHYVNNQSPGAST